MANPWTQQLKSDGKQVFPGKDHLEPEDEAMRRLKRENERRRRERDILFLAHRETRLHPASARQAAMG